MNFKLFYMLFKFLTILVLLDINEYITTITGIRSAISVLILSISIVLLVKSLNYKIYDYIGKRLFRSFMYVYIVLLSLGGVVTLYHNNSILLFERWRYYIPSILLFITFFRVASILKYKNKLNDYFDFLIYILAVGSAFIVVSVLFEYDFLSHKARSIDRAIGLYTNPNRAGAIACIAQVATLFSIMSFSSIRRNTLIVIYFINLLAAVLTFSKTAIIITSLIIIFSFLFTFKNLISIIHNRYKIIRRLIIIIFVGVLFFANAIFSSLSRLQKERLTQVGYFLKGQLNESTTTDRSSLAIYAINKIKENPITGHGIGTFSFMDIGLGVHNQFLLMLGEAGIIGICVYILFFVKWLIYIRGIKYPPLVYFQRSEFIIFFLISFTTHNILSFKPFVVVLGITFSLFPFNTLRSSNKS